MTHELSPRRVRHQPFEFLQRHPHDHAFAAVVLSGSYVEAGDSGRHRMVPGDILIHYAWERHLDRIDRHGAEVLVLPFTGRVSFIHGRINNPDQIVKLAERNAVAAWTEAIRTAVPHCEPALDWPGELARAIQRDPDLSLRRWAEGAELHHGSISRGFGKVFGVSPRTYRLARRTLNAIDALRMGDMPLTTVAHDCHFADQAHMCRSVREMTAMSPRTLRKQAR